jgi:NAD-dependent deacetylase
LPRQKLILVLAVTALQNRYLCRRLRFTADEPVKHQAQEIAEVLRVARRVLFITGAGVSAESGIPTFRGATAAFADGLTEEGLRFEEVLSGPMLARNPEVSWKYFFLLERSIRGKFPNGAHRAIAALQSESRTVWVATQNIDDLHQDAGSRNVIELHGNLRRLFCLGCDYRAYHKTFDGLPKLPKCAQCGNMLRPDAVLYDEPLPSIAMDRFKLELDRGFDLVFSVGTTSVFPYVTQPVILASLMGIPTVEINPEETTLSNVVAHRLAGKAEASLQAILELIS